MAENLTLTPTITPTLGLVRYDHGGEAVKWYNGTGADVAAGTPVVQGDLWGVPVRPIPANTFGTLAIEGCFLGPKSATDSGLSAGAPAYWDNVNQIFSSTGEGNTPVGKVERGPNANDAIAATDLYVYVQVEAAAIAPGYGPAVLAGQNSQGIFNTSSGQNYALGAILDLPDGRRFRYAKAGASNIKRALMQQAPVSDSHFTEIAQTGRPQVAGATSITVLCNTGSGSTANYFAGGRMIVTSGSNAGDSYPIVSSSLEGTDTLMDLVLAEPLRNPIAATDKVTLVPARWQSTIVTPTTTATGISAGVPQVDVTAGYYYWAQTKGLSPMIVDTGNTLVVGSQVGIPSSNTVAGAVGVTSHVNLAFPIYGTAQTIGVAGGTALINLELE